MVGSGEIILRGGWSQMESGSAGPEAAHRGRTKAGVQWDEDAAKPRLAITAFDTGRRVSSHHTGLVTGLGFALPKSLNDRTTLFDLVVGRNLEESARLFTAIDPGKAIEVLPHPWVTVF